MSWDEFVATKPSYSIALDGYVAAGPRYKPRESSPDGGLRGPWMNANHHEEVDRLATRATCAQVLMAMRQGLFAPAYIDVNDCDEDVGLSVFLLMNPHLVLGTMNPMLNRLVHVVDMLDCTAGSYPFPVNLPLLEELAWIMDPYKRIRLSGELDRKVASTYRGVIEDVGNRISRYLVGSGGRIPQDTRYTKIGGGRGWILVHEDGAQAKAGVFGDGHTTYLAVRDRPDGTYTYVLGKLAYAPLNLARMFHRLNEAEDLLQSKDQWGGGNTIGGSPRVGGSRLKPMEVAKIIDEEIARV